MPDLNSIMKVAGIAGNTIGAIGDVAGAIVQRKEAKRQLEAGNKLAAQQRLDYGQTYGDLMNLTQGQSVYKGDISQYTRAEKEAERQQMMAQNVPVSDQLYREQAGRTSANTFARGAKGAKSGVDLMSLAGFVGNQENQQMQNINIDTANRTQNLQAQANQARISTIAQTAAAQARERGLEFESLLGKQKDIYGLTREKGLGEIDMNWNLAQQNMAQRGALANSNAAIMSGVGGIFKAMGGGIAQQNMQNQQMDLLRGMYSGGSTMTNANNYGNPSSWNQAFDTGIRNDLMNLSKGMVPQTTVQNRKPTGFNPDGTYKYN
jgi:hypothetical protein